MSLRNQDLVQRCLGGDQSAWPALIDEFAGLVYGIARQHGLAEDQVDDVAQTIFTQLLKSLASIKSPEALPGWLVTSTRRECWRVLRSQSGFATVPDHQEPASPATHDVPLEALERAQMVRSGLLKLEARCRDLLWRLFLGPQPPDYDQISSELKMPTGSIGPTRRRCLAKLAEILPSPEEDL